MGEDAGMTGEKRIVFENSIMIEFHDDMTDTLVEELKRVDAEGINMQFCDVRKWEYRDGSLKGYVLWEDRINDKGRVESVPLHTENTFEGMACYIDGLRLNTKSNTDIVEMAEKKLNVQPARRSFPIPHGRRRIRG